MDKDAMGGPFPRGGANTAYARCFVGNSYLNMLSTEGVVIGNVIEIGRASCRERV